MTLKPPSINLNEVESVQLEIDDEYLHDFAPRAVQASGSERHSG